MSAADQICIAWLNLAASVILCVFAGYSAYISRKVSETALRELNLKIRPLMFSKVKAADNADDGGLIIQMLLDNKGLTEISLLETKVKLIELKLFKDRGEISVVKESPIQYESMFIAPSSDTTYDFHINKDAFEKIRSHEIAILSETRYSNMEGDERCLHLITHYGKLRNTLATYKIWHT